VDTLIQDLRFAARTLARRPGFTVVVVVTLGLGIGSGTAVFSLVNGVLLRPFPYQDPDRIVAVGATHPNDPGAILNLSFPDYETVRDGVESLEAMAVWDWEPYNLRGEESALFVGGERVSAEYFQVLGVDPIVGRTFRSEEDRPGAAPVVVLSETLWRNEFGADPEILGRTVRLDGAAHTVIGVLPDHAARVERVRLWVPLAQDAERSPRGVHWLEGIGRLAPGVTIEGARAKLEALGARIATEHPETNRDRGLAARELRAGAVEEERPLLLMLLAFVGLVLLIACANVANLLLERTAGRRHELAIRGATGASRGRLVRQILTESAVLGALGAGVGLVLGVWALDIVVTWIPAQIPAWIRFEPDLRVFAFAAAAGGTAIALFGLPAALQGSRSEIRHTLQRAAVGTPGDRRSARLRSGLVVAEVALSLALLVAAGATIRSLASLASVDPGFQTEDRMVATLSLPAASYGGDASRRAFVGDLERELTAVPGAASVGLVSRFPLRGSSNRNSFTVEGQTTEEHQRNPNVLTNSVDPSYFRTMGIAVHHGRGFRSADRDDAPAVAVVNRTLAERYWPDEDPVGRRIKFGPPHGHGEWMEVVGVVADVRHFALERSSTVQLYVPLSQAPTGRLSVVARAAGPTVAQGVVDGIRSAVRRVDPDVALYDVMAVDVVVAEAMWRGRFINRLFWIFAGLAVTLAAVGIYGVIAFAVGRRSHEIGIRVALGARPGEAVGLIVRQGGRLVLLGVAVGLPLALVVGRLLSSVLYGVSSFEPVGLAAVTALLAAVALAACWLPARRAATVDPVTTLRAE